MGIVSSPTRQYGAPSVNTAYVTQENRGTGKYQVVEVTHFGTADGVAYVHAPCDGKLIKSNFTSGFTTDADDTIALTMTNESNSDVAMLGTNLFNADPVATVDTTTAVTLSSTAANLLVDEGDTLKLTYDITGDELVRGTVSLIFESF